MRLTYRKIFEKLFEMKPKLYIFIRSANETQIFTLTRLSEYNKIYIYTKRRAMITSQQPH